MPTLDQRTRLLILIVYVASPFIASRLALGRWFPPSTEDGLWFYAGLATLLLGNLLISPRKALAERRKQEEERMSELDDANRRLRADYRHPEKATLTVTEPAHVLGVGRSKTYHMLHTNELPVAPIRFGRRIVFSRTKVEEFLDAILTCQEGRCASPSRRPSIVARRGSGQRLDP